LPTIIFYCISYVWGDFSKAHHRRRRRLLLFDGAMVVVKTESEEGEKWLRDGWKSSFMLLMFLL
jgi:hypothetical protein